MTTIFKEPLKILNELEEAINSTETKYKYKIHNLEKRITELENPLIKDKEIIRITQERDRALENLNRGFSITKEEENEIKEWQKYHIKSKHGGKASNGVSGGQWSYIFTPTSLGVIGEIQCSCGDKYVFQNI